MFPAFISSLSVFAGVLLDIQRHYEVTDSGIGLLQTGKRGAGVSSRSVERKTQAGARRAVLLGAPTPASGAQGGASCSTRDPGEFGFQGDGLRRPLIGGQELLLSARTQTNTNKLTHKVPLRESGRV